MKKKTLKNILGVSFIVLSLLITQIPMAPSSAEEEITPETPVTGPVINASGVLTGYVLSEGQTEIELPDTVIAIAENAFSGCESVTKITINSGEMTYSDNAFKGLTNLTSIVVSGNAGTFSNNMLIDSNNKLVLYTGSASEITLPKNVLSIAGGAFSNLNSVDSIRVNDRLAMIATDAFGNLEDFTFIATAQTVGAQTVYDFVYNSQKNIVIDYSQNSSTGKGLTIEIKSGISGMNEQTVTVSPKGLSNGTYYFVITTSHGVMLNPFIDKDSTLKAIGTENMLFMDLSLKTTAYQAVSNFDSLTITLPIPEEWSGSDKREYIDVYTLSSDETKLEKINDELIVKGDKPYIRFTTTHFSEYMLVYTLGKKTENNSGNSQGGSTNPGTTTGTDNGNSSDGTQNGGTDTAQSGDGGSDAATNGNAGTGVNSGGTTGGSHVKDDTPKTGDATTYKTIFACTFFTMGLLLLLIGNKKKAKIAEI